jgi:hypothetical protein
MAKKTCPNGHQYTSDKCPYCPDPDNPRKKKQQKTRLFGTTIRETLDEFKPAHASKQDDIKVLKHDRKIILFRVAVSAAVLVTAIVCVSTKEQSAGIGLFGTLIGYWLK